MEERAKNKIIEKILEPAQIYTGSTFLLKIKTINYITYNELKTKTYNEIKSFTYNELKGE